MKFKLNMLEPAIKISKIIVILILLFTLSYFIKMKLIMLISGFLLLILTLILLIGVIIELKQDDLLFQKYNRLKCYPNKIQGLYECQCCGARFNSKLSTCLVCAQPLNYNSPLSKQPEL
jgi:uncharacterized paraquat-inducible protein A